MDIEDLVGRIRDPKPAIEGGQKVRPYPMPTRQAFGKAEYEMLKEAIHFYSNQGADPGYQGPFEQRYCEDFVATMGGGYADAVATGSGAVFLALAALALPKGSEVIVSPITDPGSIAAITMNGLKPRLADARLNDYNMGVEQFLARISPNVSAVLVVHSAGQATNVDRITQEAWKLGIRVVEDCSQSHGAQIMGRPVGTFGDIAAFSTMYRKIHTTGGSGGVVYSRNRDLFRQALAHADRGKPRWLEGFDDRNPETFLFPAMNWNTDELSCAIGIASLRRLRDTIVRRQTFVAELAALIDEMDTMFSMLPWTPASSPFIIPIFVDPNRSNKPKREVAEALRAEGIDLNPHYRYVVTEWDWLKPYLADDFGTPEAVSSRNRSFCLYLNENYGNQEAEDVAVAMLKIQQAWGKPQSSVVRKTISIRSA